MRNIIESPQIAYSQHLLLRMGSIARNKRKSSLTYWFTRKYLEDKGNMPIFAIKRNTELWQ